MAGTGNTSIRSYNFFLDGTIAASGLYTDNFHAFVDTGSGVIFQSQTIMLLNDSANDIWFSFDGVNDHGRVVTSEKFTQDFRRERQIWFRGTGADTFRFWAY